MKKKNPSSLRFHIVLTCDGVYRGPPYDIATKGKSHFLRAISLTRLKAYDHWILRSLIGQKGRDRPSSLHTGRWRFKDPHKKYHERSAWILTCHTKNNVDGLPQSSQAPTCRPDANSSNPCQCDDLWLRIKGLQTYIVTSPWLVCKSGSRTPIVFALNLRSGRTGS